MGNKVIAVGLGHTGTRSLNQALIMLGIPAKHWPHDRETYHELANGVYRLSILEKYDAVTDVSVSNSSSGRRWKLDHAPAVGDPTHMVEFGTGRRAFAREA